MAQPRRGAVARIPIEVAAAAAIGGSGSPFRPGDGQMTAGTSSSPLRPTVFEAALRLLALSTTLTKYQ